MQNFSHSTSKIFQESAAALSTVIERILHLLQEHENRQNLAVEQLVDAAFVLALPNFGYALLYTSNIAAAIGFTGRDS